MEKEIEQVRAVLDCSRDIVIVTHQNPDGDAIGSALGLFHYLKKEKESLQVVTPDQYPLFLQWIPGSEGVMRYDKEKEEATRVIQKADLIFCLDFNSLARLEEMEEVVEKAKGEKVLVDHHPGHSPRPFCQTPPPVPQLNWFTN